MRGSSAPENEGKVMYLKLFYVQFFLKKTIILHVKKCYIMPIHVSEFPDCITCLSHLHFASYFVILL